jgi:outer membrane receptor for ferrienterochelin and colicins
MPAPYATSLRVSGMPVDGYRFRRDAGGLYFGSPFARGQHIPVAATASLWPAATQLVLGGVMARADIDDTTKQTIAQLLGAIAAPTPDVVSGRLAMLNTGTGSFDPVSGVEDAEGLQPTITRTLEAGYKGVIDGSIELGLDLYWSRITNFIGAAEVFTPNVFLDAAQTTAYLEPQIRTELVAMGMPEAEATATAAMLAPMLGAGYGQIPLGTVTPEGAPDSTAILLVPRNYGVVNVAGIDLSADVRIDTRFSIGGTLSLTDNALVGTSDSIPMNAPDLKASLTGRFHDVDRGVRAEARFRYAGEFAMASGVYKGTVPAYGLVDVSIGYRLPWFSSAELSVSATNLLDAEHREFVGAPSIGRMITARASYSF